MPPSINKLTFDGPMNERGFWLYVWKIHHPEKGDLLYVGRTGDSFITETQRRPSNVWVNTSILRVKGICCTAS